MRCAAGEMPQATTPALQLLWACLPGIPVLQAAVRPFALCVLCCLKHKRACLEEACCQSI